MNNGLTHLHSGKKHRVKPEQHDSHTNLNEKSKPASANWLNLLTSNAIQPEILRQHLLGAGESLRNQTMVTLQRQNGNRYIQREPFKNTSSKSGGSILDLEYLSKMASNPASPVPIPYPNIAAISSAKQTADKVKISSKQALTKKSKISTSIGDEAGTLKGLKSSTNTDKLKFKNHVPKIIFNSNGGIKMLPSSVAADKPETSSKTPGFLDRIIAAISENQVNRTVDELPKTSDLLPEVGKQGGKISHQLSNQINRNLGSGSQLPQSKQKHMETKFGTQFSNVRLHTDTEADNLNQQISARAFTLGNDIFFSNRASPQDDRVLSHELTHVVQQQNMTGSGPLTVGPSDDNFERQAQMSATSIPAQTNGEPYQSEPVLQRDFIDELSLGNLSGIAGMGLSGLQTAAEVANAPLAKMMGTTGGAITDTGALGPLGGLASVAGLVTGTQDMLNEDKPWYERGVGGMSAFSGATGTASTIAGLFGSSAFSAGGAAGLTAGAGSALTGGGAGLATGAGAATALGSLGAVLGAGAAGYGAGRLLDEGVGALGQWATGDDQGDYTISGGIADRMTSLDQMVSGAFADPDEPAYTQTLGWQLAEWLD